MSIIKNKIESFKSDIVSNKFDHEQIFQKHIVDGNSYFFEHVVADTSKEYQIKSLIADYLDVHIHEVIFVGSSKTGFSLNPKHLFSEFDWKFKKTNNNLDKSDFDIAVISKSLFDSIGRGIFDYTDAFKNKWHTNEYNPSTTSIPLHYKYCEYFSKGWFRPDMKPKGFEFCNKDSFEDLKFALYKQFKRKGGLGIYQDWYYFKYYHMQNIKNLTLNTESNII